MGADFQSHEILFVPGSYPSRDVFAWVEFAIAVYARKINRLWQKQNKTFLKVMDLFRSKKEFDIKIDYQERVRLEDETAAITT